MAQVDVVWEAGKTKSHLWVMGDVWEAAAWLGSDFGARKGDCSC